MEFRVDFWPQPSSDRFYSAAQRSPEHTVGAVWIALLGEPKWHTDDASGTSGSYRPTSAGRPLRMVLPLRSGWRNEAGHGVHPEARPAGTRGELPCPRRRRQAEPHRVRDAAGALQGTAGVNCEHAARDRSFLHLGRGYRPRKRSEALSRDARRGRASGELSSCRAIDVRAGKLYV